MEENNKQSPAPAQEHTPGGHKHRNRRHRSHRGGTGRNRTEGGTPHNNQAIREATDTPEKAHKERVQEKAPESRPHNKPNANDGQNPQNSKQNASNSYNSQKKNHKNRGGKGHTESGQVGRKFPESRP